MERGIIGTGEGVARSRVEGAGVDLDPSRRPGVPRMHEPRPLPNTRYPPPRQLSDVKVFMHGRPNKQFPPVFGTDVPPRGLSGRIRQAAFRYPDHYARHWTMLLLADRVDVWEHRLAKAAPALLVGAVGALAWAAARAARR